MLLSIYIIPQIDKSIQLRVKIDLLLVGYSHFCVSNG